MIIVINYEIKTNICIPWTKIEITQKIINSLLIDFVNFYINPRNPEYPIFHNWSRKSTPKILGTVVPGKNKMERPLVWFQRVKIP